MCARFVTQKKARQFCISFYSFAFNAPTCTSLTYRNFCNVFNTISFIAYLYLHLFLPATNENVN